MQKIPGFYTISEASEALGLTKIGAQKAAEREGWQSIPVGNVHLYRAEDVREYRDHRLRTKLVRRLGWRYPGPGQGLYRNDDVDIPCPICGGFAVEWPAPPQLPEKFMCAEGHSNTDTGD